MRRRGFIELIGGMVLFMPLVARAQDAGRVYRLGVLTLLRRDDSRFVVLFDELRQHGFIEGGNLSVDPRGFGVAAESRDMVAAAIVDAGPDAIVCAGLVLSRVMQRATQTIPILSISGDFRVVARGDSLSRPSGNTTGVNVLATDLDIKRQEILMELVAGARRMAALADPGSEVPGHLQELQNVARAHGVELSIHRARTAEEIGPAIATARAAGAQALNVLGTSLFLANRLAIIERTAAVGLPAIYSAPDYAAEGGLVAYGARMASPYRQLARQLVRVLRGTKPADIPVEQPTTFELVINLKTAKALGLEIPPALLARADEVIE